jgi:putative restriction endonuclease
MRTGINWTEDETILAFQLYLTTPFGKISENYPPIIELSKLLGRTPSAVALKMQNLAANDPQQISRGIKAMQHGSKIDSLLWTKYADRWDELEKKAEDIRDQLGLYESLNSTSSENQNYIQEHQGAYREYLAKVRINQPVFRSYVLAAYNETCCITGISYSRLLTACHIKPWSESTAQEKTDPHNGLAMNSFHHLAYDEGLFIIDPDEYRIHLSNSAKKAIIKDTVLKGWLGQYDNNQIKLPNRFSPNKDYLQYHNDHLSAAQKDSFSVVIY